MSEFIETKKSLFFSVVYLFGVVCSENGVESGDGDGGGVGVSGHVKGPPHPVLRAPRQASVTHASATHTAIPGCG